MQKKHKLHQPACPSLMTAALLEAFAAVPEQHQLAWVETLPHAARAALDHDLAELCGFQEADFEALTETQLKRVCSLPNEEAATFFYEVTQPHRR